MPNLESLGDEHHHKFNSACNLTLTEYAIILQILAA